MFEKLKANGCLAFSYNQVWNSRVLQTSTMFEYESRRRSACQQVSADYVQSIESEMVAWMPSLKPVAMSSTVHAGDVTQPAR